MQPGHRSKLRRASSALVAVGLLAALVGAGSASAATRNSFVGDFELIDGGSGAVVGRVTAQLGDPTSQRLVPGTYDFKGAPGNAIAESHAQLGHVGWWFDPNHPAPGAGGSNVAFADGVECLYFGANDAFCHEFAVMFIDDINPAFPDQVAFADHRGEGGDWEFTYWFLVGRGDFVLRLASG
jgi:prepilin-type processing-associated H-X9-DG protein